MLRDDGEIESKEEDNDNESTQPLEDTSDVEFAIDREALIAREYAS